MRKIINSNPGINKGGLIENNNTIFLPNKLPGLAAWYSADYGVLSQVTNAADFVSANSQSLSCTSNPSLQYGDIDFTWAGWGKISSTTTDNLSLWTFDTGSNPRQMGVGLNYVGSTPRALFYIPQASPAMNASVYGIPVNQYVFCVAWRDKTAGKYYLQVNNGTPTEVSNTSFVNITLDLRIGAQGTIAYSQGQVALVGFWKRALTNDERTFLYNNGTGRLYSDLPPTLKSDLISYWNLTETSGTRNDSHGSNNLTDNNSVGFATGPYATPAMNGQTMRRWLDRSGNGRHLEQPTLLNQATLTSGELTFSAVPTYYTALLSPSLGQPCTLYYVCIPRSTSERYLGFGQSGTMLDVGFTATSMAFRMNSGVVLTGAVATFGSKNILCAVFNGVSSTARVGNNVTTGNAGSNSPATTAIVGAVNVSGIAPFLGGLCEVLAYAGEHTLAEQSRVINYLAKRWGIGL